jgi:tripartite-type tricarboxylate transporter receptor subunit TctC
MRSRKAWSIFAGFLFFLSVFPNGVFAAKKDYPNRPIELVVGMAPGGPTDVAVRVIQAPLQAALGVPIIISNKSGGAGAMGAEYVASAKPDGYTLLTHPTGTMTIVPVVNPTVPYKPSDFVSVCFYAIDPVLICSKPNMPWKDVYELIAYAKKNPGKLNYGSSGMGAPSFFVMESFKLSKGLDIVPVHYQGSGPAKTAILGGHVDLAALGLGPLMPLIKAGNVIPILTTGDKKELKPPFDKIPTMVDLGIPEASISIRTGISAPAKTPKEVIETIERALEKIVKDPAIATQMEKAGSSAYFKSSSEMQEVLANERVLVEKVSKRLGIGTK